MLIQSIKRLPLVVSLALLGAFLVAPAAQAQVLRVDGGSTTLEPDTGTAGTLSSAGFMLAPVDPARAGSAGLTFPVTSGRLTRNQGTIRHSGGVSISGGGRTVALTDFLVTLDRTPDISAVVDGQRISAFDLSGTASVTTTRTGVRISGPNARLTPAGSAALNSALGTTVFRPALQFGQITTRAQIAVPEPAPRRAPRRDPSFTG